MLFLLNKTILEVDAPELYLSRHWKRIGCGDPAGLRASDAVNFASMVVTSHIEEGLELDEATGCDLAALIISKTGANAVLFPAPTEAKLNVLPEAVLEGLRENLQAGHQDAANSFWTSAA